MFPGVILLWHLWGVDNPNLIYSLILGMFGFLFLTAVTGFAYDSQRQTSSQPAPSMVNARRVSQVGS
jgi:hypothetical protein